MLQNLRYFSFRRFGQIQKRIIHNKNHLEDEAHQHSLLMQQYQLKILDSQQVLVIQPWFHASSPRARHDTTEELMLQESLGLVKTLGWTVVDKLIVTIQEDKGRFLGTGQLERLSEIIAKLENKTFVSAVFLSTYKLGTKQRILAEEIIGKSVIDRYSVILQIFAKHAQSKEAKLQVQLAEIPYLKSRLISDLDFENDSKHSKSRKGKNWFDKQRLNLNNREKKLKLAIDKIKDQRKLLRSGRIRNKIPSIAVIGYTNSGKTSLIKALTSEEKLEPKNELFATLDVTAHSLGMLLCPAVSMLWVLSDLKLT